MRPGPTRERLSQGPCRRMLRHGAAPPSHRAPALNRSYGHGRLPPPLGHGPKLGENSRSGSKGGFDALSIARLVRAGWPRVRERALPAKRKASFAGPRFPAPPPLSPSRPVSGCPNFGIFPSFPPVSPCSSSSRRSLSRRSGSPHGPRTKDYYATFFPDPDGLKLEFVHFPWGYWRRAQTGGMDERARYPRRLRRRNA